jgi:uncharacterized membrane protein YagU involved in acid resistance
VATDINAVRVIFAGLVGALSMALASYVFNAMGVPMVDFGRLIATKMLGYHSHGTRLGFAMHLVNGVLLALLYAVLVAQWLPGTPWMKGIIYGILLWLGMMLVVLPALGDGVLGLKTSRAVAPSALAAHLLYGLSLGLISRI